MHSRFVLNSLSGETLSRCMKQQLEVMSHVRTHYATTLRVVSRILIKPPYSCIYSNYILLIVCKRVSFSSTVVYSGAWHA